MIFLTFSEVGYTVIAVLSISFEVDVPTGKVGGSLVFECRRHKLPTGSGGMPPQKILKFRCFEILFSMFSRQYLGLKNNKKTMFIIAALFLKISITGF